MKIKIFYHLLYLALFAEFVEAQTSAWIHIYTDAESLVQSSSAYAGTLIETPENNPYEGSNHYRFDYLFNDWWADATLHIRSAPDLGVNFLSCDHIQLAYRYSGSARLAMDLSDLNGQTSALVLIGPASATNRLVSIPVSSFTGIDLSNVSIIRIVLDSVASESGTVYFDAIRLENIPDLTPPTVPSNLDLVH